MVNARVLRATNDKLLGPDWSRIMEICDICNSDPAQGKSIVKGIKNRLRSKRPKVQLLALTLLETILKNCSDIVHMLVAERELPCQMVKIFRKKPNFHVKEKILTIIYTWQEAFGGPSARYPQYFAAYQELLRLGAVSQMSAPVFRPSLIHPLTSHPQTLRSPMSTPSSADSSVEHEFPALSRTEIEKALGIMDTLAEMLNALGPDNKQEVKQDVIVDLVDKCRTYKLRVIQLVSSTMDESLLSQGLALHDDLQRLLAKHKSIYSRAIPSRPENKKPEPAQSLVNIDAPLIDTGDEQSERGSTPDTILTTQLSLPAPPTTNSQSTTSSQVDSEIDLLSGDYFNLPALDSLALIPVGETQPARPAPSNQNALALIDIFPQSNNQFSSPHFQQQSKGQSPQPSELPNGSVNGVVIPQHEQSPYSQGLAFANYGVQSSGDFPPPSWEAQLDNSISAISQPQQFEPSTSGTYIPRAKIELNNPVIGTNMHPLSASHYTAINAFPQETASYSYGYSYEQYQNAQYLEQNMSALRDSSYSIPSRRATRADDKLFGDLVDISKFRAAKAGG